MEKVQLLVFDVSNAVVAFREKCSNSNASKAEDRRKGNRKYLKPEWYLRLRSLFCRCHDGEWLHGLMMSRTAAVHAARLGGTRTPSLLIRRSMEGVWPVRRNTYQQVSVLPSVQHGRRSPAPSGQSVRKL